jgi:hypothetical protein
MLSDKISLSAIVQCPVLPECDLLIVFLDIFKTFKSASAVGSL